ncbi:uncharacterized protein N7511_000278 [Penicillium nucicola]|uniref:uncharacterized protein n=1 Tax=Penicillium nucicola TaxID=1850975 RepID=UPI00254530E2|nr:uncharacterized protein N7511_000278 [Penicillium nucicola]KAJ5775267.1 hypothetical protein N7511_000278 [Penicillium nucicola]
MTQRQSASLEISSQVVLLSTQISPSLSRNSVPSPFPSIHFQDAPPKRALLISLSSPNISSPIYSLSFNPVKVPAPPSHIPSRELRPLLPNITSPIAKHPIQPPSCRINDK